MTKKIFSAPLLLLLLVFFGNSCKKIVTNIEIPSNPKPVVGCFISPEDSVITVRLSYSQPIFSASNTSTTVTEITDAAVVISSNSGSMSIPYMFDGYELPTSSFPILAGQTYSLTVTTTKGENLSASCTVPSSNIASFNVEAKDSTPYIKTYKTQWNDILNESNYYRLYTLLTYKDSNINFNIWHFDEMNLFNDNKKDGKAFEHKMSLHFYSNDTTKRYYHAFLMNIDAEYYKYYYSLKNNNNYDPFSEPSPIYTNIKNGLGIFAAYRKKYKRVP